MTPPDIAHLDEIYENIYEQFEGDTRFNRIFAVGDSFTNAGNVDHDENYPYYLWERLSRKSKVVNLGICEDTSVGSLLRIQNLVKKQK